MKLVSRVFSSTIFLSGLLILVAACYYDKADVVYPPVVPCDTATVGFKSQVQVILQNQCLGCHGAGYSASGGGIDLRTYETVLPYVNNGSLLNSVLQNGKASYMPKGGKLSACDLKKVSKWIRDGSANN